MKRLILFLSLIIIPSIVFSAITSPQTTIQPGADVNTVALFHLNEGVGTATRDNSVRQSTGALYGGITWGTGMFDRCVVSDGTDGSYVDTSYNPTLYTNVSWTVSIWIKTTTTTDYLFIYGNRPVKPFSALGLAHVGGSYFFQWYDITGTGGQFTGYAIINDGKPHQIVAVRDMALDLYLVYVDGRFDCSQNDNSNGILSQNQIYLGKNGKFGNDCFTGSMEEYQVIIGALSAAEIKYRYERQLK